MNSDQYRCATKLLSAYREGDTEEIERIARSSAISHLDSTVIKINSCFSVNFMSPVVQFTVLFQDHVQNFGQNYYVNLTLKMADTIKFYWSL